MLSTKAVSKLAAVSLRQVRGAPGVTARIAERSFATSSSTAPPPTITFRAPHGEDPSIFDKTAEEMRLYDRTDAESEYKLGKHRSNAIELIEKIPIVEVDGEMAICDGGGGALGHPLEYISLERPGVVESCKYCGLRFASKKWGEH